MSTMTSALKMVVCAAGVAVFLAVPASQGQFAVSWDFQLGEIIGTTNIGACNTAQYGTPLSVYDGVSTNNGFIDGSAISGANASWQPASDTVTGAPIGWSHDAAPPGGNAADDAWLFSGPANAPQIGPLAKITWVQQGADYTVDPDGSPTPIWGGGSTGNPTWGDGTLGSASYMQFDLPTFENFTGTLALDGITFEAGSHGVEGFYGPCVMGFYAVINGTPQFLDYVYHNFEDDPVPAMGGGVSADPPPWNLALPYDLGYFELNTSLSINANDDVDFLFYAGWAPDCTVNRNSFVLDNMEFNFTGTTGDPGGPSNGAGGSGGGSPAGGTPEPAAGFLALIALGLFGCRRNRRS